MRTLLIDALLVAACLAASAVVAAATDATPTTHAAAAIDAASRVALVKLTAQALVEARRVVASHKPLASGKAIFERTDWGQQRNSKLARRRSERIAAGQALTWEPAWTTDVAASPLLGAAASPDCLAACGWDAARAIFPRSCCSRCGMYARGRWRAAVGEAEVARAVGNWTANEGRPRMPGENPAHSFHAEVGAGHSMWAEAGSRYFWAHEHGDEGSSGAGGSGGGSGGACALRPFSPPAACRAVCGAACRARCRRSAPQLRAIVGKDGARAETNVVEVACSATLVGLGDSTLRSQLGSLAHRLGAVGILGVRHHGGSATVECEEVEVVTAAEGAAGSGAAGSGGSPATDSGRQTSTMTIVTRTRLTVWALHEINLDRLPAGMARERADGPLGHGELVGLLRHADAVSTCAPRVCVCVLVCV